MCRQRTRDGADGDLVAVRERVVRVRGARVDVDRHRHAVLEREPAVAGEVVGVGVRLEDAHDPDAEPLGLRQVLLDRVGGVDEERLARSASPTR